jgi:opacity protein-like surface antigen
VTANILSELLQKVDRSRFEAGPAEFGVRTGVGIRYPDVIVDHASTKLEYLYSNFGRLSFANGPISNSIHFSEHVLRAGISFGFSGW